MTPIEEYMAHLDKVFQQEPVFYKNDCKIPGLPGITSIVYNDIPEKGFTTGLTYGLSLFEHPDWKLSRPELCISLESSNIDWGQVVGYLANHLRDTCPFCYGDTIDFEEKISDDSEMSAFFIFAPSILEPEDYLHIDIGIGYEISIAGLYPMYAEELEVFSKIGLDKFWHHPNFDLYNVNRKRIIA